MALGTHLAAMAQTVGGFPPRLQYFKEPSLRSLWFSVDHIGTPPPIGFFSKVGSDTPSVATNRLALTPPTPLSRMVRARPLGPLLARWPALPSPPPLPPGARAMGPPARHGASSEVPPGPAGRRRRLPQPHRTADGPQRARLRRGSILAAGGSLCGAADGASPRVPFAPAYDLSEPQLDQKTGPSGAQSVVNPPSNPNGMARSRPKTRNGGFCEPGSPP